MKKNNYDTSRSFIPKTIGESLKSVNNNLSNKFGKIEYMIYLKWDQIVGQFFSNHSEPSKISSIKEYDNVENEAIISNILHVNVSPAAAVDFQHFKDKIIEKINSYFGYRAITGIKILQNFTPKLNEKEIYKKNSNKNSILNTEMKQETKYIKNKNLEQSVVKLGLSIISEDNENL